MGETSSVLLIEDDVALGRQVVLHLRKVGLSPVWWRRGRPVDDDDLSVLSLVVLDLMLPGLSGLDVLRAIRSRSDVPVLVISARRDGPTTVRALELGADDYVHKPFWPEELLARVQTSADGKVGA